jgi:hypothetical protein
MGFAIKASLFSTFISVTDYIITLMWYLFQPEVQQEIKGRTLTILKIPLMVTVLFK